MNYKLKNLISRCKKDDHLSKEEIISRLTPLIKASIKRYYYGKEEYDDLLQDGYIEILSCINKFDEKMNIPFLGYIKIHLKFFYMDKGRKSKKFLSLNNAISDNGDQTSFIDMIIDESIDIEKDAIKKIDYKKLLNALNKLTYNQKRILFLYYFKNIKFKEIAKMLGVHYQTVIKTKDRGIKNLKLMY